MPVARVSPLDPRGPAGRLLPHTITQRCCRGRAGGHREEGAPGLRLPTPLPELTRPGSLDSGSRPRSFLPLSESCVQFL